MTALLWIVLLPPVCFVVTVVAGRLLGARRGWMALVSAGVIGTALGVVGAGLVTDWGWSTLDMVLVAVLLATLFTMLVALGFDLVRPRGSLHQGPAAGRITVINPVAEARRQAAPFLRYREVLAIARRRGLLSREQRPQDLPRRVRETLEEAGGIFVKLGQVASTRTDVLPPRWCDELALLRSSAEPVPEAEMRPYVEAMLGGSTDRWFDDFDWNPLADASIAQVYAATLREHGPVIVKVQRPGLDETFRRDAAAIRQLASLIDRRTLLGLSVHPAELAEEFLDDVADELDFEIEAANAAELATALAGFDGVRIPTVHREHGSRRLLIEEKVDAPSIGDHDRLGHLDVHAVASRLVEAFLHQIFDLGVFHADPHPGNILIERDGTIVLIDLGAVGRIGPGERDAVLDMLAAAATGEASAVRQALERITIVDRRVDSRDLDAALDGFLARNMRAGGGITAATLEDLVVLIGGYGIRLPRWFGTLVRTMVTLEGTLVGIDPEFSLVDAARAHAGEHRLRPHGAEGWRDAVGKELLAQLPRLRRVPGRLDELLGQAVTGGLSVQVSTFADERDERVVTRLVDRIVLAVVAAASGLASVLLLGVDSGPELAGGVSINEVLGYVGIAASAVLGMRVVAGVVRDGET